jgi:hypothetical protein
MDQTAKRNSGDFPKFHKTQPTHIVYKEVRYMNILYNLMRRSESVFLCAVIRNPLSVTNSWLRAPREFRRDLGWDEQEEWRYALKKNLNRPEEFHGYEKWKEAANIFLQLKARYPSRVHVAQYSKFLTDVVEESEKLFGAVGLELTDQTREFLRQSSSSANSSPYSVFRADQRDDKWKTELHPRIAQQIVDDLKGSPLEEQLLMPV